MKTNYFTFGQAHVHRVNDTVYDKDCVVMISSEDPRQTMFDIFSDRWSMQYESTPDLTLFPKGIVEIDISCPQIRYRTSHEIARLLLDMPDLIAVIPAPIFDMPGELLAAPVGVREFTVQGTQSILIEPLRI